MLTNSSVTKVTKHIYTDTSGSRIYGVC